MFGKVESSLPSLFMDVGSPESFHLNFGSSSMSTPF